MIRAVFLCPRPLGGALSDYAVWRLSVWRLTSDSDNSRTETPRKTKISTEVLGSPHYMRLWHHFRGQKVKGQLAGAEAYCGGLPHSLCSLRTMRPRPVDEFGERSHTADQIDVSTQISQAAPRSYWLCSVSPSRSTRSRQARTTFFNNVSRITNRIECGDNSIWIGEGRSMDEPVRRRGRGAIELRRTEGGTQVQSAQKQSPAWLPDSHY